MPKLGETMFEYIVIISIIVAMISLVSLITKHEEVKSLKKQLIYMNNRYERLRKQLEYYLVNESLISSDREENLDMKILELHLKGYPYSAITNPIAITMSIYNTNNFLLRTSQIMYEAWAFDKTNV